MLGYLPTKINTLSFENELNSVGKRVCGSLYNKFLAQSSRLASSILDAIRRIDCDYQRIDYNITYCINS